MYRIVAMVLSLLVLMQGSIFGETPIFTAVGNFYPSTVCKLGSQVTGRVETVYVQVGDSVKKGQPLVQLDKRPFEIEFSEKDAILQSAKIELQDAQLNYQRMKKLWQKPQGESPSISQKKFEEAKLRYEQAKVKVIQDQQNLNRAKLHLEEATIRASFDGIVSNKFVDPGEAITNNDTYLVEIQAMNPLFLEFSVPQAYLNSIKVGTPISFEVEGTEKEKFHAKIDLIYPCIDETTGTVTCRAIIDNPSQELHPGSLAKVEIHKL